ncbi:MAG: cytochrome P460 family protein [Thermodesulfovibrionales bacterium]
MKRISIFVIAGFIGISLVLAGSDLLSAQDKYAVKALNGLSFEDIRGYETWQVIAPSYRTDKKEVRYILGNTALVDAYKKGSSKSGIPFPDGAILVKIAYSEIKNPAFPAALEPDVLQRIEFMMKDSKKFSSTGGWGYARFVYEPTSNTYTAYGKDASFADECYQCHTLVKDRDYVFTKYPVR